MGPQATAEVDETTATREQDAVLEADMLASFAEGESSDPPTTLPVGTEGEPANPERQPSKVSETDPPAPTLESERADEDLPSALKRLASLEDISKKSADALGGRLGSLEQVLKTLQAATPVGQPVRVSLEDYGEFGKEYPEFADAQIKVLNKVLDGLKITGLAPEFTSDLIKNAQTAAVTAVEARVSRDRATACWEDLDETHEGWRQLVGLPDKDLDAGGSLPDTPYRKWLATQPQAYRERIEKSFSPIVIGKSIDKFTAWQKAQAKPAGTHTMPSTRHQQLSAAVAVKSTGTKPNTERTLTEEEAMLLAFEGKL